MKTSTHNLRHIGKAFHFKCNTTIFTQSERNLLKLYGPLMEALAGGAATTTTVDEIKFVGVSNKRLTASKGYEFAWLKLMARREWEEKEKLSIHYYAYDRSEQWFARPCHWREEQEQNRW
jgi:uncharacterized protein YifE (UPF0438 family)